MSFILRSSEIALIWAKDIVMSLSLGFNIKFTILSKYWNYYVLSLSFLSNNI